MSEARGCRECESRLDDALRRLWTRPGITAARWSWAPIAGEVGHVLVDADRATVHMDPREPGLVVRCRPGELPLASRSVPALVVAPVLPGLPDLDGVFAELRRVLRPHGLLTIVVPDGPPLGLPARRLRNRVRACWAHRSVVDHPGWLLAAADFAVLGDDRAVFHDPGSADDVAAHVDGMSVAGVLPQDLPAQLRAELIGQRAVRSGRVGLRRLVARR